MELKQLKYFIAVAGLGSYTRAAEQLDVAQPVLSRQIRQLEIELRCNLLNRHGRGVTLTEQGALLFERARQIEQMVARIHEDLKSDQTSPSGHLTIGLPPTVARMVSLPMIRALRQALPLAQLSVSESLTATLHARLNDGTIDIALLNSPVNNRGLKTTKVSGDRLYLIARADDADMRLQAPVQAATLASLPLIMPSANNTFKRLVEQSLTAFNLHPNIVLEIDSVAMILDLVREGSGYAVLSRHVLPLTSHADELKLVPIEEPELIRHLFLAVSDKRPLSRLQERGFEIIKQVCEEHFGSDGG